MKILAVDYGLRRIGLASGSAEAGIAFPKGVIFRKNDAKAAIDLLQVCKDGGYDLVIFGMPLSMNGEKSDQWRKTDGFVNKFKDVLDKEGLGIKVETVDERLSSFEADSAFEDLSLATGVPIVRIVDDPKSGARDMMAAKVILERYFSGNVV